MVALERLQTEQYGAAGLTGEFVVVEEFLHRNCLVREVWRELRFNPACAATLSEHPPMKVGKPAHLPLH